MVDPFRSEFNTRQFSEARYAELKKLLNRRTRTEIQFQISETPCFFPRTLLDEMAEIGRRLVHQLIDNPAYMAL